MQPGDDVTHQGSAVRNLHLDVDDRPFIIIWEVTRACALACAHCRAESMPLPHPDQLTTAQGKALLDDLAEYGSPRPMIVLTGGDPFERPDLIELVAYGTGLGLHISVAPSVTPRLDRSTVSELRLAGTKAISLSLDGATPGSHDGFRRVDGVYDATIDAARTVVDLGLRLQINTTVTSGNVTELPAILRQVIDLGAGLWSVFFLVSTGRAVNVEGLDAPETEEVLHWLHEISSLMPTKTTEAPHFRRVVMQRVAANDPEQTFPPGPLRAQLRAQTQQFARHRPMPTRRRRPPLSVNAGRGFGFIDHLGRVFPSGFLPVPAGSVQVNSFPEIYRDSPLFRSLRDPNQLGGRCGRCEFRTVCGGSRSSAFAASGDPLAEDPACSYIPVADRRVP